MGIYNTGECVEITGVDIKTQVVQNISHKGKNNEDENDDTRKVSDYGIPE